jgi:hypothetical protein
MNTLPQKPIPKNAASRIRKMAKIPDDLRAGKHFAITRLTVIKNLCREWEEAAHFAVYIAQRARERIEEETPPEGSNRQNWEHHEQVMDRAIAEMERALNNPLIDPKPELKVLLGEIVAEQNEFTELEDGPVRIISNRYLLVVEDALRCFVSRSTAYHWAYQAARNYSERSGSRFGTGLNEESAPMVEDIVRFWCSYYDVVCPGY